MADSIAQSAKVGIASLDVQVAAVCINISFYFQATLRHKSDKENRYTENAVYEFLSLYHKSAI